MIYFVLCRCWDTLLEPNLLFFNILKTLYKIRNQTEEMVENADRLYEYFLPFP